MKTTLKIFLKEGKTVLRRTNGISVILDPLNHNMVTMTITDDTFPQSQVNKDFIATFIANDISNMEDIDHYLIMD
jgi:hypothetical protein